MLISRHNGRVLVMCAMLLALILQVGSTTADEDNFLDRRSRNIAPVQGGPNAAVTTPEFEPGKIHIQLARPALSKLSPSVDARGLTVTGIPALDKIGQARGTLQMQQSFTAHLGKKPQLEAQLGLDRWYLIEVDDQADIPALIAQLRRDPDIDEAVPVVPITLDVVPNDPQYADNWGHNNTGQLPDYCWGCGGHPAGNPVGTVGFDANAEVAWNGSEGFGNASVRLAILDSGADVDHPDLNVVGGYDFINNDPDPDDTGSHGTACSGVAAAISNNGIGVAGVAGNVPLLAYAVGNNVHVSDALMQAVTDGADVASMSFSFVGAGVGDLPDVDAALEFAYNGGITLLSSSGNENDSEFSIPAVHPRVMSIGAASPCGDRKRSSSNPGELNPGVNADPNGYTCDGERWWGSNYGVNVQDAAGAIDLIGPTILPTTDVLGSGGYQPGDYEPYFNGTSCSTPYVAGVAALIKSYNPTWTPDQVRAQLRNTAIDIISVESGAGWDRYTGYGMIDAAAAVNFGPVAPTAEFSGTPTSGDFPLNVTFTDLSTGTPTSWSWDFGDGVGTSTAQNPQYTYTAAGSYTVSLTATNAQGSDGETKVDYITVTTPSTGGTALAESDIPVDGSVTGTYLNTHTSDNNRQSIEEAQTGGKPSNRITFLEHKWTFTVPVSTSLTFNVEGSRSNNPDGDDFTFAYSTDNVNFTDMLTVNSATEQVYSASIPTSVSGTVYIRAIDTDRTAGNTSKDDVFVDHMFIDYTTTPVTNPPVADFTGSPTSGNHPLVVNFTDQSTNSPTSWLWDFGDASGTSTAQNPQYTYTAAGTYTVSLTATNAIGSDGETKIGYITVTDPPIADDMYVSNIVVTRINAGGGQKRGQAVVTILDENDQPVSGATVTGDFSGVITESGASGVTNGSGQTTIQTVGTTSGGGGDICFAVTNVTHGSLTYNASLNSVTESCQKAGPIASSPFETAAAFELHQNRPNPFNPTTEIRFALPDPSSVTIEVFDVAGRRVEVLAKGAYPAGEHMVAWQAKNIPSGVYFYRIVAGEFTEIKKMILMK